MNAIGCVPVSIHSGFLVIFRGSGIMCAVTAAVALDIRMAMLKTFTTAHDTIRRRAWRRRSPQTGGEP